MAGTIPGKCHAGAVNTACPLCAVNMTECAGKKPDTKGSADLDEYDYGDEDKPEGGEDE